MNGLLRSMTSVHSATATKASSAIAVGLHKSVPAATNKADHRTFRTLSRPLAMARAAEVGAADIASMPVLTQPHIPGSAPLSARLRKSPFFDRTLEAGVAEFTVYNRMLMPLVYSEGYETEYRALTEDAAIWDVAAERQVELKGPDAAKLAQLLTCRDISGLEEGKCVYAIMTDMCGVVINDPVLLKLADNHYWFSIADSDVVLWAKGVASAQMYDVEVREPDVSPLAIQGPKSVDILCELYGSDLVDSLKYFGFAHGAETHLPSRIEGKEPIPTLLARSGWSPEHGYEIYLKDSSRGSELWDMVAEIGAKYNLKPGAPNQQRRVEGGMLSFGGDTLGDTNALELGLPKRFVDPFGSHEFIGKAALQKIHAEGVRRKFLGFEFLDDADAANVPADEIWRGRHLTVSDINGQDVGVVTACSSSPKFGCNLGIGIVDSCFAKPGTVLNVQTASGNVVTARLSTLPFKSKNISGGRAAIRQEKD